MVFGKLIVFAVKATWGITKIVCTLVFLPVILIALFAVGLVYIALPLVVIIGIVSLIAN